MKIEKFEYLISWQKSKELTFIIYELFDLSKDFSFRDQIQRASVFMMNNIAEGFERIGNKELRRFSYITKGSCGELRPMLYVANELKYINKDKFNGLYNLPIEISKLPSGFIKKL